MSKPDQFMWDLDFKDRGCGHGMVLGWVDKEDPEKRLYVSATWWAPYPKDYKPKVDERGLPVQSFLSNENHECDICLNDDQIKVAKVMARWTNGHFRGDIPPLTAMEVNRYMTDPEEFDKVMEVINSRDYQFPLWDFVQEVLAASEPL